jgi:hypothetical protein
MIRCTGEQTTLVLAIPPSGQVVLRLGQRVEAVQSVSSAGPTARPSPSGEAIPQLISDDRE